MWTRKAAFTFTGGIALIFIGMMITNNQMMILGLALITFIVVNSWISGHGDIEVNMGQPMTDWHEVPLAREMDTLELPIEGKPTATSMGNPHCTFFVNDVDAINLEAFGPTIEHHPLFPERTNVQIAQIIGPNQIRMRVWERGVGITLASGSSSCAVAVAATRRGLIGGSATLTLDGGEIRIKILPTGVHMTGTWAHVFDGHWRGIR